MRLLLVDVFAERPLSALHARVHGSDEEIERVVVAGPVAVVARGELAWSEEA